MGADDKVFLSEGPFTRMVNFVCDCIEKPVIWFRENVVVPNRKEYYWYHEKIRRVPTVDECYTDDIACIFEADEQYKRDRKVDTFILEILRKRLSYCLLEHLEDREECDQIRETHTRASNNYFIKYGDLPWNDSAIKCLMKQKNRMAFERRYGPVGSGKNSKKTANETH